jgi:UDP-glucose 4-epimerase
LTGRRVLVTGASTPLARAVMARLAGRADVETVVGVNNQGGVPRWSGPSGPVGAAGDPTRSLGELVDADAVDTIIHVEMCPSRSGTPSGDPADVISTLHVAAAASSRRGPIRTVVAVSSTEVYPASARAPTWRREDELLQPRAHSAADLVLEAEDQLRDVAQHQPHISVAILRLADLAGPTRCSGLTTLLRGVVVPVVPGYDPAVQLLHVDDAARAIEHAVTLELAGTFNVAGDGVVRWRQTARIIGRRTVPLLPEFEPVGAILRTFKVPPVPTALIDVLRFGRCADTAALTDTGFTPGHSTEDCVRALAHRSTARRAT